MKTKRLGSFVLPAVGALAASGSAVAQPVTLMDMASITESGQSFTFEFTDVLSAVSEGTLLIEALGDFSPTPPSSETLDWSIDGIASGGGFNDSAFADPADTDLFQNAVSQEFTISLADMQAITGDGVVTIDLQASDAVNFFTDQPEDFVSVALTYTQVPGPAPAGVLALAGLAAARRRR